MSGFESRSELAAKDIGVFTQELAGMVTSALGEGLTFNQIGAELSDLVDAALKRASQKFKDDFVSNLSVGGMAQSNNSIGGELLIIPDGVRFFYCPPQGDTAIAIIEQPPQKRTLRFRIDEINPDKRPKYTLALPYTLFLIRWDLHHDSDGYNAKFKKAYMAYRNAPFTNFSDQLFWPNLPNLGGFESDPTMPVLCMGTSFDNMTNTSMPLFEQVSVFLKYYWTSTFTNDWSLHYTRKSESTDKRFRTLSTWEKASKEKPLFVLDVKWEPMYQMSVLLKKVFGSLDSATITKREVNTLAGKVYDVSWQTARRQSGFDKLGKQSAKMASEQLRRMMEVFVLQVAQGLAVLPNPQVLKTVHNVVRTGLQRALRESGLQ